MHKCLYVQVHIYFNIYLLHKRDKKSNVLRQKSNVLGQKSMFDVSGEVVLAYGDRPKVTEMGV
jgi:hypothetical protein